MILKELALQVWEDEGGLVLGSWEDELDADSQNARDRHLEPEFSAVEGRNECLA